MSRETLLFAVLFLSPLTAIGQDSVCGNLNCDCCESRLRFLDDVLRVGCCGEGRDPFEERIETERHDFTQSTKTVGRGVAQLEMGYSHFYNDKHEDIEDAHTTPEMMVRVGLTDDIEFRVRWNYAWVFVDEGHDETGAEDLRWSFKLGVTEQDVWVPESALEIRFTAPTGAEAFSSRRIDFGLDYIFGWELNECWSLYGSTGFATDGLGEFGLLAEEPGTDHSIFFSQSVAVGNEITERMTMYNEFYALVSHGLEDELRAAYYNIGVDYYITDNFVIDFRVGVGLTPDSDDLFSGLGGGYRF